MTDLTTTEITIALAAGLTGSCYVGLILMPALALLRARLGEARGELPHPLHTRHAARASGPRSVSRSSGATTDTPRARAHPLSRVLPLGGARVGGTIGGCRSRTNRRARPAAPAEPRSFLDALEEVSEAVEAGAGLPSVARAAGRALDASVIVLDSSSSVLAVACASPEDERAVMARRGRPEAVELHGRRRGGRRAALPRPRPRAAARAAADGGQPDRSRGGSRAGARARQRGGGGGLRERPSRPPNSPTARDDRRARRRSSAATSRPARACSWRAPGRSTRRRATGAHGC